MDPLPKAARPIAYQETRSSRAGRTRRRFGRSLAHGAWPPGGSRVSQQEELRPGRAGREKGRTVTPERWRQVKVVLDGALETAPTERTAFVAAACGEDGELRSEVESLLALEEESADFIEEPLFGRSAGETEGLPAGRRVGPYRVVREIGRGGMGA